MDDSSWKDFASHLAELARNLLAQETVQDTLDLIVDNAVRLVDGCDYAGILTVEGGRKVRTLASTHRLVRESDAAQGEYAQGPCFDAARKRNEIYRIKDMTTNVGRWPRYAPRARQLGIGSMMGILLYTEDDNLGALDMYAAEPRTFSQESEQAGWLLASHAAVALSSARSHAQLATALESRSEIGEALGILMERYKVSEAEAFAVLRKSSQDQNVKLRDIARRVTETGEIPGAR
ncbi:GAF and ANTAR domain-containing protein [Streptomyces sp. DSM 42041]|uniref:GAF and ANTAR domain-containing protein n=1 Tax=Streptomyces hazeniae TaxID=3075538 RepID=A0ABU2NM51_9ACTN|nr:GAF and ANTAR domain-containing protein [Streptomyces sp. DSM 42041]MDT0377809.1 GAF and ANTAR domain-containing protein [Streptomyces sp. DSM 42041]